MVPGGKAFNSLSSAPACPNKTSPGKMKPGNIELQKRYDTPIVFNGKIMINSNIVILIMVVAGQPVFRQIHWENHVTHSETPWQATSNSFNDVVMLGPNCTFPIAIWAHGVVGRTAAFRVLFRVTAGVDRIWSSWQCRNGSGADDKTCDWRTVCTVCEKCDG